MKMPFTRAVGVSAPLFSLLFLSIACAHDPASKSTEPAARPITGPVTLAPYAAPGGYLVMMPANPELSHHTQQTLGGPVQTEISRAQGYEASVSTLPDIAVNTMDPKSLLKTAQDSSLKELKAKLASSREVTADGMPGREFVADGEQGRVTGRVLLGGAQLYTLMATYPSGAEAPATVNQFLQSFKRMSPQ